MGVAVEAPKLGAEALLGSVPGEAQGTEHAASMIGQGRRFGSGGPVHLTLREAVTHDDALVEMVYDVGAADQKR